MISLCTVPELFLPKPAPHARRSIAELPQEDRAGKQLVK